MKKNTLYALLTFFILAPCLFKMNVDASYQSDTGTSEITDLILYYSQDGVSKEVSLLHLQETLEITCFPVSSYVFEVKFKNPEQIDSVYITSTDTDNIRFFEAIYDEESNSFIADCFRDRDEKNYVPGVINVQYTKKRDDQIVSEKVDWDSMQYSNFDHDTLELLETSNNSVQMKLNLSELLSTEYNVFLNTSIEIFDSVNNSNLDHFLGAYQDLDKLTSYIIKGKNNNQYVLYLDYSDPKTYAMIVKDVSNNRFIKMILDSAEELSAISNSLSQVNTTSKMLYNYYSIQSNMDELRTELQKSSVSDFKKAIILERINTLEQDQKMFSLLTTILPVISTTPIITIAALPSAPAILFSAMLGAITASSDYFWDYRIGLVKSDTINTNFTVSGSCGDDLTWSLNGTGQLTISGTGKMTHFSTNKYIPWFYYARYGFIKSIVIKPGITSISRIAFCYCSEVKEVVIPDTVTQIGGEVFEYCTSLEHIVIPQNAIIIPSNGHGLFGYHVSPNLKSAGPIGGVYDIEYGWSDVIPAYAFSACENLSSVVLPAHLTEIGNYAFAHCESLIDIDFPSEIKIIGECAFTYCKSLARIDLPDSISKIGKGAFGSGKPSSSRYSNNTAYYSDSANWENDVLYIGKYLISARSTLKGDYSVKDGTTCITDGAFQNSSLDCIEIPDSVTFIGESGALKGNRIFFHGDAPKIYQQSIGPTLYYIPGTEGWTDSMYYDDRLNLWNRCELEPWDGNRFSVLLDNHTNKWACVECINYTAQDISAQCFLAAYGPDNRFLGFYTTNDLIKPFSSTYLSLYFPDDIGNVTLKVFILTPDTLFPLRNAPMYPI